MFRYRAPRWPNVAIRMASSSRGGRGAQRILCRCLLDAHPAGPRSKSSRPAGLAFGALVRARHRGLFLDDDFGGGGEKAAVEREELPIYVAPHDRSRKLNILRDGWQFESFQCCIKPGRLHRRACRKVRLSERRREWTIRKRNSPSPASQVNRPVEQRSRIGSTGTGCRPRGDTALQGP
jgi:hypothetical protein